VEQWRTDQAELTIHAPIRGQVTTKIAELGENFGVGAPLFSIVDLDDVWFTFNLREDLLGGLKVGDEFTVAVPAMQNAEIPLRVTVMNAQGQFATWRATRATGDFDLRTFEVRAEPITPHDGLRPGMSGIASWDRRGTARR
jgi:HlyD family secretion protein